MGSSHLPCKVTEDFYETTRCYEDWAPTPWLPAVPNRLLSAMWTGCQWGNQAAAARGRFREVGRFGLLAALMGVFFFGGGGNFHSYACSQSPSLSRFRNLQNRIEVSKTQAREMQNDQQKAKNNAIKKASTHVKNMSHFFLPRVFKPVKKMNARMNHLQVFLQFSFAILGLLMHALQMFLVGFLAYFPSHLFIFPGPLYFPFCMLHLWSLWFSRTSRSYYNHIDRLSNLLKLRPPPDDCTWMAPFLWYMMRSGGSDVSTRMRWIYYLPFCQAFR